MSKKIATTIIATAVIIVAFYAGYFVSEKRGGSQSGNIDIRVSELMEDKDFYSDIEIYLSLLSSEEFSHVQNQIDQLDEERLQEIAMTVYVDLLMQEDERSEDIIFSLKEEVESLKGEVDLSKQELFEKNTQCAELTSGIKNGLGEKDELVNIFYSTKGNSCLYTIHREQSSTWPEDYESTDTYIIYNANSEKELNRFKVYDSDMFDEPSIEREVKNNRKDFTEFVLEHSGYNIDLFEGVSYTSSL